MPLLLQRVSVVLAVAMTCCTLSTARAELVLHVDFENSSDLTRDVSVTGASGLLTQLGSGGTLTQTTDAAVGNGAADFFPQSSGTAGLAIEYPDTQLPDFGSDTNFAISYWVKPTTAYLGFDPNHAMFSAVASGADAALSFQIENKGDTSEGQFGVARFSGPFFEAPLLDGATNLTAGVWHNVAAVSNGQNGRLQIFVDGNLTQEIDSVAITGSRTGVAMNEIYLGMNRGQNKLFDGFLDDVRVYDTAAVSELLSLTGSLIPRLVVDRDTGAASIVIPASGSAVDITSYTITSANRVLDPTEWQPISGGSGTADSLSESFAATTVLPGTPIALGDIWQKGPFEDLYATALLSDGTTTLPLPVAYEGNGGNAFLNGDIFDIGDGVDLDDWVQFKSGQGANLSGLNRIEAYLLGDLDGDGDNDGIDFALFEQAFDAVHGPGALVASLSVPEPSSLVVVGLFGVGCLAWRFRSRGKLAALTAASCLLAVSMPTASAQLLVYDGFDVPTLPAASDLNGTQGGQTSFGWDSNPWTDTIGLNNQPFGTQSEGLGVIPGLKSVEGYATRPARNQRTAINREIGATELDTLTAEGSEFWFSVIMANRDTPDNHDESVFLFAETPLVDIRAPDFATGFDSNGQPTPPFRSIGIMFDDGNNDSGSFDTPENPDVGFGDGDAIYAVYTDGSGGRAVYSDPFRIGEANEPHLIIGHVTWGGEGEDHNYDIYALGVEDIVDPLAPIQLPAAPFGSLTIPAASIVPADLNTIGVGGTKLPAFDEVRFGLTEADVIPSIARLTLEVDVTLGTVTLINETAESLEIDYLEIKSADGSLDPDNWTSLSDNPSFPTGNNDGLGWEEGTNNDALQLIESYLLGATIIAPDMEIVLGQAFSPGSTRDLTLAYHLDSAGAVVDGGIVRYVGELNGDYNGDGAIDAADYVVWRNTLGSMVTPGTGADGNEDGEITQLDYQVWRSAFSAGAAASTLAGSNQVPEPATCATLSAALLLFFVSRQTFGCVCAGEPLRSKVVSGPKAVI